MRDLKDQGVYIYNRVQNFFVSCISMQARPMNHNTGVDLALLVFDMISLKPLQSPLVFPGCTTVLLSHLFRALICFQFFVLTGTL